MSSEYAEIKRLEREIEKTRITVEQLEDLNKQLKDELKRSEAELKRSEAELKRSQSEAADLRRAIAIAKDPNPVKRCSLKRVQALASNACMAVERLNKGWLLKFGRLERHFRFLGQIWQILIQEDWALSDVFPPEPPRQQKAPRLPFRYPVLAPKAIGIGAT